ncbi:MAG TPA: glycosyltransferase family 39 protein [Longimicrobiales bacterium]|nr:glycosyltransferase family 39 protein [Longimicrobiales bacterium]
MIAEPSRRGEWLLPLALCGAFLLLGLLTLGCYGATWDEPMHRIAGERVWAYVRTGDSRLIDDLPGGGRYYGPLFYMLNYGLSELAHGVFGVPFTAANHLLTLVTATLGLFCTYRLAELLVSRRAAVATAVLLILLPPFMAHAHYNPKDIPLLTLAVATLLFASRAYRTRRTRHAILTGVFLGVALSMKPTVVVLLPIIGGAVLADLAVRRAWHSAEIRAIVGLAGITTLSAIISLLVGWPTLWRDPNLLIETIRYFGMGNFWTGEVLYFGRLVLAAELPWHYLPVMLLMSMPLITLALAVLGGALLVRQLARPRTVVPGGPFAAVLLLLWVLLPVLMFMKPGLPRYDGMRQVFFMVPAVAILAGAGWDALWRAAAGRVGMRRLVLGLSAAGIAWLAAEAARFFPYGGSYTSAAARAVLGPALERRFEIEYWGASYREGARWLQQHAAPGSVICVPLAMQVLEWQPERVRDDMTYDCDRAADFVMMITRTSQWPYEYLPYAAAAPVFRISRAGSDLLHVYRAARPARAD